ncbi:hypothetical protein YC2023_050231 [Brassica napus]
MGESALRKLQLRVLFSGCMCVGINSDGERWELALGDLEREIDESVYERIRDLGT